MNLSATKLLAILNVTPDSFSDGGRYTQRDALLAQAEKALSAGAFMLDVGGESTRPGSEAVAEAEELSRVVPAIEALKKTFPEALISIDTRKGAVAEAALEAGASWVNDVSGLRYDGERLLQAVVKHNAGLILMHSIETPKTMQQAPHYSEGINSAVEAFLARQANWVLSQGVNPAKLVLDAGFGFGKTLEHNLTLLNSLGSLQQRLGFPLLAGVSRKSFLACGKNQTMPPEQREAAGMAAHALAWRQGVRWFRVHDVAYHAPGFKLLEASSS